MAKSLMSNKSETMLGLFIVENVCEYSFDEEVLQKHSEEVC
jgi:hypothetical protein